MNDLDLLIKIESEKTVLSAIFLNSELIKDCVLIPQNFGLPRHNELFKVFKALDEKGLPIEPVSVFEEIGLENQGLVGGLSYVMDLTVSAFSSSSFEYHQELIIEYYKKREVMKVAHKAMRDLFDTDAEDVMRSLIDNTLKLEDNDIDDDNGRISDVLIEVHEWMETNHGEVTGATTGFRVLDLMTGGLQRQDLIILGARPSMGKTALATNICLNYAMNKPVKQPNGGPVAMFSMEMRNRALVLRMISNIGYIDGMRMRNPIQYFNDEEWGRTTNAFGQLGNLPLHMFDTPGIDIAYIRKKLRMMKRLYPNEHVLVMIDYLQLIQGNSKNGRTQEISEISRSLKLLARELDMTIIALSQLSRGVESRQDKRPMLSDLRESGQIEQDADVIAFLYRDDYYDNESELAGIVEIILAKQRNGPVGTVSLAFAKEYSKFVNIIKPNDNEE